MSFDAPRLNDPGLNRRLGLFAAVTIVIGCMVGSGVFKKAAPMAAELGSAKWVIIAWILAGMISLFGALTYAELSHRIPHTGGPYAILREIFGKSIARLYGWSCFAVIQSASIASIAYVSGEALAWLFGLSGTRSPQILAAIVIILLTTANYRGVALGSKTTATLTCAKLVGMCLVTIAGFWAAHQYPGMINALPYEGSSPLPPASGLPFIKSLLVAMLGAFWAYDGWINAAFVGGEIHNPSRNVPRALVIGTLVVIAFYVTINFSYLSAAPVAFFKLVHETPGSIAAAELMALHFSGSGKTIIMALIFLSTLGATSASVLASARIYYALAHDLFADNPRPFWRRLAQAHPRFHTPDNALILQCIWSIVLLFSGSFDQLTDMLIFAQFFFFGLGAYGLFRLRKHGAKHSDQEYRVPTLIPLLYLSFCLIVIPVTIIERPREALMGIVLMALGTPFFVPINARSNKSK